MSQAADPGTELDCGAEELITVRTGNRALVNWLATMKQMTRRYAVVLHPNEEGFAVACPGLPGCWSQGADEQEALENIQDAIREYLAALKDQR